MGDKLISFEVYKGKIRKQIKLFNYKSSYINLLSVYDMLMCERMAKTIVTKLINEGIERNKALSMAENVCLCVFCVTDENFKPIFNDVDKLMKSLTNEEILNIVNEYNLLRKNYLGFDKLDDIEFESLKKN